MSPRPALRRLLHAVAVLLTILVLIALVRAFRRDGPAALAAWRTAHVRWPWIALAIACALAGHAVYILGWQRLLADCGVPIGFIQAARLFFVSNVGRYLPGGKAWQMGIIGVMAAEDDLPAPMVAGTSLVQGMVGVAVGAILLLATGGAAVGVSPVWFVVPVVAILGLLVAPAVIHALPRVRAPLVKHVPSLASVNAGTMWALVWTTAGSWIGWGIGLWALASALLPAPGASVVAYVGAWIGPFIAGLLAIVSPAGLGVRDEAMRAMLGSAGLAAGSAMVVAVVARVGATILDVVPALAVLGLRRRRVPAGVRR